MVLTLTVASLGAYVARHALSHLRRRHLSTWMAISDQPLRSDLEPVNFSPLAAVQAAVSSKSFGEFMAHLRSKQGDAVVLDLWPFAPKTYLLMGKEANRDVLSSLDRLTNAATWNGKYCRSGGRW